MINNLSSLNQPHSILSMWPLLFFTGRPVIPKHSQKREKIKVHLLAFTPRQSVQSTGSFSSVGTLPERSHLASTTPCRARGDNCISCCCCEVGMVQCCLTATARGSILLDQNQAAPPAQVQPLRDKPTWKRRQQTQSKLKSG